MNRNDVAHLLTEAMRITKHSDYVIIGSLSVLGATATPPDSMTGSIDVDLYPKNDPGRAYEIAARLGLGSDFEQRFGYYADAVSPMLPTLPEGWEQRLIKIDRERCCRMVSRSERRRHFQVRPQRTARPRMDTRRIAGRHPFAPNHRIPFARNTNGNRRDATHSAGHRRRPQGAWH